MTLMRFWKLLSPATLRVRILLALALLGALPLGLVGLALITVHRKTSVEQSARELVGLAQGLAMQLDNHLDHVLALARTAAALPAIVSMDPMQQRPVLQEFFQHHHALAGISVFNRSGELLASSHVDAPPSVAIRESFQAAVQHGAQRWMIAHSLRNGQLVLIIHSPIRDEDRRVGGVTIAVIDLGHLSILIGSALHNQGIRVFVLDSDGWTILHPDRKTIPARVDYSWLRQIPGGALASPGLMRFTELGEAHLAGYASVPSTGWLVVTEQPESMVVTPVKFLWRVTLIGLGASGLLSLLIAFLLSRSLIRPLRELATAARAFGTGAVAMPLPVVPSEACEVGVLVRAFGAMREAVMAREQALQNSEARFRRLIATAPVAIFICQGMKICYGNRAAEAVTGFTHVELAEMSFWELVHPEFRAALEARERIHWHGEGTSSRLELKILGKGGEERWIDLGMDLTDFEGQPAVIRTAYEITARKQAAAQLFFQASLLDQVSTGIVSTDLTGRIIYWNKQAAQLYQWTAEEVVGRHISEVKLYHDPQERADSVNTILKQTGYWEGEYIGRRKDGSAFPTYVVDTAICDAGGQIIGYVGLNSDITARKQIEAEAERRRQQAEILADLGRAMNASLDMDLILQQVVERSRQLCASDAALIALREPASQSMVFRHHVGGNDLAYAKVRLEPGKGVGGQVLCTGRPFRTDHYATDPRISSDYQDIVQAGGVTCPLWTDHVPNVPVVGQKAVAPASPLLPTFAADSAVSGLAKRKSRRTREGGTIGGCQEAGM